MGKNSTSARRSKMWKRCFETSKIESAIAFASFCFVVSLPSHISARMMSSTPLRCTLFSSMPSS